MSNKKENSPLARLAAANPVRSNLLARLGSGRPALPDLLARFDGHAAVDAALKDAARANRASRRRTGVSFAVVLALVLLALPPFGLGERLFNAFDGTPVPSARLSQNQLHVLGAMATGTQPRLAASEQESLARVGAAHLRRIATRDGRSYYVANRAGGGLCLTITYAGDPNPFVGYRCSPDFPSPEQPLADESVFAGSLDAPVVRRIEGFAADGVATVAVVTADGSRVTTPVEDNVYLRTDGLPTEPVREIVALDPTGNQLYSQCLTRGGCSS